MVPLSHLLYVQSLRPYSLLNEGRCFTKEVNRLASRMVCTEDEPMARRWWKSRKRQAKTGRQCQEDTERNTTGKQAHTQAHSERDGDVRDCASLLFFLSLSLHHHPPTGPQTRVVCVDALSIACSLVPGRTCGSQVVERIPEQETCIGRGVSYTLNSSRRPICQGSPAHLRDVLEG